MGHLLFLLKEVGGRKKDGAETQYAARALAKIVIPAHRIAYVQEEPTAAPVLVWNLRDVVTDHVTAVKIVEVAFKIVAVLQDILVLTVLA